VKSPVEGELFRASRRYRGDHDVSVYASGLQAAERRLVMSGPSRDVLSPREVAERAGFSYHAILRAIRRGDLRAFEPVPGHYRIDIAEYERWLRRPARREVERLPPEPSDERPRAGNGRSDRGSFARLQAIEGSG
jgi:excisionase family DNA binding protein